MISARLAAWMTKAAGAGRAALVWAVVLSALIVGHPNDIQGAAHTRNTGTVLTIGELSVPTILNPLLDLSASARDVTAAIFESLLTADTHNALQPALAKRYTVSANGLTYSFGLDPHARWQDGVPVTAADVLYTAKLMRDPQFPAVSRYGFGYITSLRSDGPLTVTATLRSAYAPFLRAFATTPILPSHVLSPIPAVQLATYDAFNRRPTGSGPYTVTEFTPGERVVLAANSAYSGTVPEVAQLQFRREASATSALADLRAGRIGMLGPSTGLTPKQIIPALQSGTVNAFAAPGSGWTHIDLIESGFLRDHLVRQALTYATPRQQIVSTLFSGLATPADADQPPTSIYYDPAIAGSLAYDPSRVSPLLKSRGYSLQHGVWRKFKRNLAITLWTDSTCGDCVSVAKLVAASWTKSGMPTVVKTLGQHKLFGLHGPLFNANRLYDPGLNAVLYTWSTSPEPDDSYYWASSMIVRPGHLSGGNFDGYSNPTVDKLTSLALVTVEEAKRVDLYRRIQRLLVNDQPDVFLYWTAHLTLVSAALHGYRANPYAPGVTWNVEQWTLGT